MSNGSTRPEGSLSMKRVPRLVRPRIRNVQDALRYGSPPAGGLGRFLSARHRFQWENRTNFWRSLADQDAHDRNELPFIGHLWLAKIGRGGDVTDLGLASCRVVTTTGVGFIVDAFQNLVELENMKYHAIGTGTAAEAVGNTGLTTELTTQYSTSSTRPTGTLGEQSGNANVYETTATITVSAAVAVTEHGIFSTAAANTGVLLDRSVFAAVNLASGESLQATYDLTFPAGG